jgi:hypothetical protein
MQISYPNYWDIFLIIFKRNVDYVSNGGGLGSLEGSGGGHLANPQHCVCNPIRRMTEHSTFGGEVSGSRL